MAALLSRPAPRFPFLVTIDPNTLQRRFEFAVRRVEGDIRLDGRPRTDVDRFVAVTIIVDGETYLTKATSVVVDWFGRGETVHVFENVKTNERPVDDRTLTVPSFDGLKCVPLLKRQIAIESSLCFRIESVSADREGQVSLELAIGYDRRRAGSLSAAAPDRLQLWGPLPWEISGQRRVFVRDSRGTAREMSEWDFPHGEGGVSAELADQDVLKGNLTLTGFERCTAPTPSDNVISSLKLSMTVAEIRKDDSVRHMWARSSWVPLQSQWFPVTSIVGDGALTVSEPFEVTHAFWTRLGSAR